MAIDKHALLRPLFDRLESLDALSDEERAALIEAAGSEVRTFAAKQEIVAQGSRPAASTLVLSGLSARQTQLRDGDRLISGLHLSGDFVDLHSLVIGEMDHSIVAMSDCTVINFPHGKLRDITARLPHLTRLLWLLTLIDAAMHRQWLVVRGGLDSLGEAAHLLCEMYLRHQMAGLARDHSFPFPLTQQDFGDALGKSLVQTNRVIQTLRKLGVISWQGQQVRILDWDQLAEMAEFDPTYLNFSKEPR